MAKASAGMLTDTIQRVMGKASGLERHRKEGLTEEQAAKEAKAGWCQYKYISVGGSFVEADFQLLADGDAGCFTAGGQAPTVHEERAKAFGSFRKKAFGNFRNRVEARGRLREGE